MENNAVFVNQIKAQEMNATFHYIVLGIINNSICHQRSK